jgi:hypothetical protein
MENHFFFMSVIYNFQMEIIIKDLIEEYYKMKDGERINNFHESIFIENYYLRLILKYRVLKHIVEQRKRDGYSLEQLRQLFADIQNLVEMQNYLIIENKKEVGTNLFIEIINDKKRGIILVLEVVLQKDKSYVIKTGFYRASSKIKKLLK